VEKCDKTRQATGDNMMEGMRFACWITKTTDTPSEYVILMTFPRQYCLRERTLLLRYTYFAYLVHILLFSPHC